jgi:hypothetical protein
MKLVCAWCGKNSGKILPGEGISHGICRWCAIKFIIKNYIMIIKTFLRMNHD